MTFVNERPFNIIESLFKTISEMEVLDSLVIGAGPAGLTSGIYLGRYLRTFLVVDGGNPRASWIPTSRNFPAWPDGIHGWQLLKLLREQAVEWGTKIESGRATNARKRDGIFYVDLNGRTISTRTLLIATGIQNLVPSCISESVRILGTASRVIRFCPICDPPEMNSKIAVIGSSNHGAREALFMSTYTNDITIIPAVSEELSISDKEMLNDSGIKFIENPIESVRINGDSITVYCSGNYSAVFKSIYPSLGSKIFNELLLDLGVDLDDAGLAIVNDHCMTSVDGLYAAGDITVGLDQIDIACGQASIATTDIHNKLRRQESSLPSHKITVPIKGGEINH